MWGVTHDGGAEKSKPDKKFLIHGAPVAVSAVSVYLVAGFGVAQLFGNPPRGCGDGA